MSQPLVSAITIFLNEQDFITEAIESVLAQTSADWELILVDDGSTDGSTAIARGYADRHRDRIRYVAHDGHENRGMSASRNLGIRHARGRYLAFLDADDIWLPQKFERQIVQLEAAPEAGMLCSATEYWYSWTGATEETSQDHVREVGLPTDVVYDAPALSSLLYPLGQATAPCMCSLLVRADAMRRIGGFEETFTGFYEDQAMLAKMYLREKVLVASGCWDRYRIHPASCSARTGAGHYNAVRKNFLEWLSSYVQDIGISDNATLRALDTAMSEFGEPPGDRRAERTMLSLLRLAGGNSARLVFPPDNPDALRLEITTLESVVPHDVQISHPRLAVRAGRRYSLTFLARADDRRSIGVGFAKGHAPWTNLGFYDRVDLEPAWRSFAREFDVTEDEDNARIHFDVGDSPVSLDISAVALRDLADGTVVRSAPRSAPRSAANRPGSSGDVLPGQTDFGSFRRVLPISQDFGYERGRPIDRYYVENFLESRRADVRGRVLEVGERSYTTRFGGDAVSKSDILHVTEGDPEATIIADLADADHIPSDLFDCIILTQTLQLIYDARAAIRTLHRILKPGGVLLATFPGITQTYDVEWGGQWYWSFTGLAAKRLFGDVFGPDHVEVGRHGNVLAAVAFLHGLSVEEVSTEELDFHDPAYDVTITVRAVKGVSALQERAPSHASAIRTKHAVAGRQALILMYHRVAEDLLDPWSLSVAPGHFAEQLEVLQKHARVIPLRSLIDLPAGDHDPKPSVVLTFDDGYADNLFAAKPILERFDAPATVFIATGYTGLAREFWWDELESLTLSPSELPARLELEVNGTRKEWSLGNDRIFTADQGKAHGGWLASDEPPTGRHRLFLELWTWLQMLPFAQQRALLDELWRWSGREPAARSTHRVMAEDEIRRLGADGLVEIGAHSVTHPVLPALAAEQLRREVTDSRRTLEKWLGTPVTSFAYPYGAVDTASREAVAEAGFTFACSTLEGAVPLSADPLALPRVEVRDWAGADFERHVERWLRALSAP